LQSQGLLGEDASEFGSPDEMMLLSSGPNSHLATFSLLCGPSTTRIIIRQPSTKNTPPKPPHSPLNGDIRLSESTMLTAELQQWDGLSWEAREAFTSTRDTSQFPYNNVKIEEFPPNEDADLCI
jgi:hypothetical protein